MKKLFAKTISLILGLSSTAFANDESNGKVTEIHEAVPNNEGKHKGDKLEFSYDVILHDINGKKYCLPAGEDVRILDSGVYKDKDSKEFPTFDLYRISNYGWTSSSDKADENKLKSQVKSNESCSSIDDSEYLARRQLVTAKIGQGGFMPNNAKMSGFSYGVLLVPYKYYTDSKNFTGAATIAPYMGISLGIGVMLGLNLGL